MTLLQFLWPWKSCQGLEKHSCKAVLNVICAAIRFDCIANIFLVAYVSSDAESEKKSVPVSQDSSVCPQKSYFQLSSEIHIKTEVY